VSLRATIRYRFHPYAGRELEIISSPRRTDLPITVRAPDGVDLKVPRWMFDAAAETIHIDHTATPAVDAIRRAAALLTSRSPPAPGAPDADSTFDGADESRHASTTELIRSNGERAIVSIRIAQSTTSSRSQSMSRHAHEFTLDLGSARAASRLMLGAGSDDLPPRATSPRAEVRRETADAIRMGRGNAAGEECGAAADRSRSIDAGAHRRAHGADPRRGRARSQGGQR
jgi:hypothetical protein